MGPLIATDREDGDIGGVDILHSNHGPLVIEGNATPGLEGIEAASGVDVAGKVIRFLEEKARPHGTRTRGRG